MKNRFILSLVVSSLLVVNSSYAKSDTEIKALKSRIAELKERLDEIEDYTDIIETKVLVDKVKFGLGMRVERNSYTNTYANGSEYKANDIWRTKLNLNMKSKIYNNLKFTGRLSMYKNWGDSTPRNSDYDSMQGRKPDSSALYVERAYIDWIINKGDKVPFILTLGRQPSSDGPSYQIKEGMKRKGTYDALAFDGAADGVVLTANLDKVTPGNTSIRVAYGTPNVLDNERYTTSKGNYAGRDNTSFKNTKVTGFFIDKRCSLIKSDNLIQAYFVKAKDLDADPELVDSNSSHPTYMQSTDVNVGDLDIIGAMFEVSKIGGKVDAFIHYARSEAKPNGKLANLGAMGKYGLLTSTANDTTSKTGNAIWLGTRVALNKTWAIGGEYNKGSKNWFNFTSGANDPLNKLSTRGKAYEGYVTMNINRYANIRFGYIDIKYDYTGSGNHLGAPKAINSSLGQAIKETKNAYITFNVLF